jgi:Succinylglutamate desuccinylase / Aspartoacylase family
MFLLIGVLIIVLILVFMPVQNFQGLDPECHQLDIIEINSGMSGPCLGIIAGVHGNEPAGSITLMKMLKNNLLKPKRGKIIIIPRANQCGLDQNTRGHPLEKQSFLNSRHDLNRQFTEHGGSTEKSNQIVNALGNCDLILDFHEGWGWYIQTKDKWGPTSLGSTLFGTSHPLATKVAANAVKALNEEIDPSKKFVQLHNESCEIPSTLSCHFEKKNRAHVVIETTGQNDIQPLAVREHQVKKVIQVAMQEIGI